MADGLQPLLEKEDADWRRIYDVIAKRTVRWKFNIDIAKRLLDKWKDTYETFKEDAKKNGNQVKHIEGSIGLFTTQLAPLPSVKKKINRKMLDIVVMFLKNPKWQLTNSVRLLASSIIWQGLENRLMELLSAYDKWMKENDEFFRNPPTTDIIDEILEGTCREINSCKTWSKYSNILSRILSYAASQPLERENGYQENGYGATVSVILQNYLNTSDSQLDSDVCAKFVPHMLKLLNSASSDIFKLDILAAILKIANRQPEVIAPHLSAMIDWYLGNEDAELPAFIQIIQSTYPCNEEAVLEKLDPLVERAKEADDNYISYLLVLLEDVARHHPDRVKRYNALILESLETSDAMTVNSLKVLVVLSSNSPVEYVHLLDTLIQLTEKSNGQICHESNRVLANITINNETANRVLWNLFRTLETAQNEFYLPTLVLVKRVGENYKTELEKYENKIRIIARNTIAGVPELSQTILTIIDQTRVQKQSNNEYAAVDSHNGNENPRNEGIVSGTVSGHVTDKFEVNGSKVGGIDGYLQLCGWALLLSYAKVKIRVQDQDKIISEQEQRVVKQNLKIKDLERKLEEQGQKIAELSTTDISDWFPVVAKVMDPRANNDWRYMAIRLGYSFDDVQKWGASSHPAMEVLNDLYQRYDTQNDLQTTLALLASLRELYRHDAIEIIENALESVVGQVIQHQLKTIQTLPKVYIAHSTDDKDKAEMISRHIEMAGVKCSLKSYYGDDEDRGNEGENSDMYAAKLVLIVCTQKSLQKDIFSQAVKIATLLNKPVVFVLIESFTWSQDSNYSSYVRLPLFEFSNSQMKGDQSLWRSKVFTELLGEVIFYVSPDFNEATKDYRDWMIALNDIPVRNLTDLSSSSSESMQSATDIPPVLISYQWSMQHEAKQIYARLTKAGFSCWLDIFHLGGSECIYNKIEKLISGFKVVVMCVSRNFLSSKACRQLGNLVKVLQVPILPIQLEDISWPEEDALATLIQMNRCIDFTEEFGSSTNINDDRFGELLTRLREENFHKGDPSSPAVSRKAKTLARVNKSFTYVQKTVERKRMSLTGQSQIPAEMLPRRSRSHERFESVRNTPEAKRKSPYISRYTPLPNISSNGTTPLERLSVNHEVDEHTHRDLNSEDKDSLLLNIKLPNGTRLRRYFRQTDTLEQLLSYTESHAHAGITRLEITLWKS
uniref:Uncharacterized protein LOC100375778 n=1 Tax=Saccoglossus kowalevskii TaxID=10224 RepID=A0ABM0GVV8_SACKO|nr:PREDICTED: uncharacterized protein LOC100375778 [Saccoglossus kowalevskii]